MTKRIAILVLGVAMSMGLALRANTLSMANPQDDKMESQDKGKMKTDKMDKMDKKDGMKSDGMKSSAMKDGMKDNMKDGMKKDDMKK